MLKAECYQGSQEGNYQYWKIEDDLENIKIGKKKYQKQVNYLGRGKTPKARRHNLWHKRLELELQFWWHWLDDLGYVVSSLSFSFLVKWGLQCILEGRCWTIKWGNLYESSLAYNKFAVVGLGWSYQYSIVGRHRAQKSDCLSWKPCSATYQLNDLGKLNNSWVSVPSTSNRDDSDVWIIALNWMLHVKCLEYCLVE